VVNAPADRRGVAVPVRDSLYAMRASRPCQYRSLRSLL
jgi:hypothetical protein